MSRIAPQCLLCHARITWRREGNRYIASEPDGTPHRCQERESEEDIEALRAQAEQEED
jgi:hypothetical protein